MVRKWGAARLGLIMAAAGVLLAGCGGQQPASSNSSKFEVAEEETPETPAAEDRGVGEKFAAQRKSAPGEAEVDSPTPREGETGLYRAPSGPPQAQLAFIERMLSTPLVGNSVQSQKVDYEDRMAAVITSCDLIVAHRQATDEQKRDAISTKFYVLSKLSADLESVDYAQRAMAYAAELQTKVKGTIEKEMGVTFGVQLLPQQFSMLDSPNEGDVKKLVEGYLSYLDEGPLPPMFLPGLEIVRQLNNGGFRTQAIGVLEEMIAAISAEADFPDRESSLKDMNGQLRVLQNAFPDKLRAAKVDDGAFEALDGVLDDVLREEGGESKWLQFLHEVGLSLEQSGRGASAAKVYARLAKNNENAQDAKVGEIVKKLLATAETRRALAGQTLDFTAPRADGSEFSLSSLQGKRVVLLFWTTSDRNGFNGAEFQNLQRLLLEYNKPFEVVLVNIDDDVEAFRNFSQLQGFDWATASVRCPDADLPQLTSDLEKRIGIDQAPFGILIDREGKVEQLFAQGPRLAELAMEEAKPDAEKPAEREPQESAPPADGQEAKEGASPPPESDPPLLS